MTPSLPPIQRPPHDPTSLLLNERLGWKILEADKVAAADTLRLERFPGSLRWLTESSGSFGGLRTPSNVAFAEGQLWLLDRATGDLKRFDPCSCRFDIVPCFNAAGAGIAVCGDSLFIAEPSGGRLSVYATPDLVLRGHWQPGSTWQPEAVVIGGRGVAYVADPLNGAIHRFSRHGVYLGAWTGFGPIRHLAIDRHGTIYAAGDLAAYRVGKDGAAIPIVDPADDLAADFEKPPFLIDREGNLHLGPLCLPPSSAIFDRDGNPVEPGPAASGQLYEREGMVVIGPLDSLIDHCTWHRAIFRGSMPDGSRIELETYTSNIELPKSEIDALPESLWETRLQCLDLRPPSWDGLLRSPKGRYLWLRLKLFGKGSTTPELQNLEIEFPRVSLRRFMPAVYGFEPVSADFTDRLMAIPDRSLRDYENVIDRFPGNLDPLSTPFLGWLASWVGVTLDRQLPESLRRQILKTSANSQQLRGTRLGLWRQLVTTIGFDRHRISCQCDVEPGSCRKPAQTCPPTPKHVWTWEPPPLILEHFKLRRWMELGVGRLGDDAMIWGKSIVNRSQLGETARVGVTQLKASQDPLRDPFHVYAHKFTVFVPACAGNTPEKRRSLENLIKRESPAHTLGNIEFVEARMRIGFQSMIGLDAVVARVPQGVRLGETPIGPASVLTGDASTRVGTGKLGSNAI
jgi:phage tail-like protein